MFFIITQCSLWLVSNISWIINFARRGHNSSGNCGNSAEFPITISTENSDCHRQSDSCWEISAPNFPFVNSFPLPSPSLTMLCEERKKLFFTLAYDENLISSRLGMFCLASGGGWAANRHRVIEPFVAITVKISWQSFLLLVYCTIRNGCRAKTKKGFRD